MQAVAQPMNEIQPMKEPAYKVCGAKTRNGGTCKNAGMTNGRCKFHGGMNPVGASHHSYKTGRYSKSLPSKLAARYEESLREREQLSLRPEIALIDAKLNDLLGRIDDNESGASWKALLGELDSLEANLAEGKMVIVASIVERMQQLTRTALAEEATWQDIRQAVHDRRLLAESERKRAVEAQQMITAEQAMTLMGVIENIIITHVADYDTRRRIGMELAKLVTIDHGED